MLDLLYGMPLWLLLLLEFIIPFLWWSFIHICVNKIGTFNRFSQQIMRFLFIVSILIIFRYTICGRYYCRQEIVLYPFSIFTGNYINSETLKEMNLNMLLFLPFGMYLYAILNGKVINKMLVTFIAASCLSLIIEVVQYYFRVGWSETRDVICNTLGAVWGCFASIVINKIYKLNI